MQTSPIPIHEELRLKDLYAYAILDTEEEKDFNDLVELVSQICNCPMAMIAFVDRDRQWFKAGKNIFLKEGGRKESLCSHTILQDRVMVVNDALEDERFFDNPLVTGEMKIRFYAGATITSASGYALGTVCVIDKTPKYLSPEQLESLRIVSSQISRLLELRLKNKQLAEAAEGRIQAEKQIRQMNIARREEENYRTAYALHEKIAQTAIAVKMYISLARKGNRQGDNFLDAAYQEIDQLTRVVTGLSKSITPTTLQKDNYENHIKGLVLDFQMQHNRSVQLEYHDGAGMLHGNIGLMIFRIVQDLLQISLHSNYSELRLDIHSNRKLFVLFEYNPAEKRHGMQDALLEANIASRVELLSGSMVSGTSDRRSGAAHIIIEIPVSEIKQPFPLAVGN